MKNFVVICTLLLAIGGVANAAGIWVSGNVGDWSDTANWDSFPGTTSTATINNGTANLDTDGTVAILLLANGVSTDVAVLNIDSDVTLSVSKSSSELLSLVKTAGSGTVNQSAGLVKVFQPAGTAGELRLANSATGTGTYNLSGGILDVQVLNKGASTRAGYFNATGGTLIVRTKITKFGLNSAGVGFNQGQCTLAVGGISEVGALSVGDSSNATDYTVGTGGTLAFDIASASFDIVTQYGSICNIDGATLSVNLLDSFVPAVDSFFDVWTFSDKTKAGSGSFAVLPTGWSAAWVDTDGLGSTDTLRLTYVPEPATMLLLGLGGLVLRRRK